MENWYLVTINLESLDFYANSSLPGWAVANLSLNNSPHFHFRNVLISILITFNFHSLYRNFTDCSCPDEDGKMRKRPTSLGQLLGKSKWEKPLVDWIIATGIGLVSHEMRDNEAERVERNDGWRREP
jgi:hypothetical protein